MNTLVCVLCCIEALVPIKADINNAIIGEFSCVNYVDTIEYNGRYAVGVMTDPFFSLGEKRAFERELKEYISAKYGIDKSNIRIVFNITNIHLMKNAKNEKDIANLIDKVYKEDY